MNMRVALVVFAAATMLASVGCAAVPTRPTESLAPRATTPPGALTDSPAVLRLAVADADSAPSKAAVDKFVRAVAADSGGNVTVVPTFDAGKGTLKGFEVGVADIVQRGEADLGVVGSRAWDLVGVTSLQALQAPYLIDNDALMLAVAQNAIARRSLDGMGSGVVGLTLWPEDLRHLFSFHGCPRDFRSPAGLRGAPVLWPASALTRELLTGMGAIEYVEDDRHLDAASCKLQGQEGGLGQVRVMAMSDAAAVGNITLFPKYQVLVANQSSFDHLSDGQRRVLLSAAADVQADVIGRHPSDAALALAWCQQGGSVIAASDEQRRAFEAAAAPVYARLETDPLTKQLIAEIRALKASTLTSTSTSAKPCVGGNEFVPAPTSATSDGVGYSGDVPPNGTFRAEVTYDGLIAQGATDRWARDNAGVWTWTFRDGTVHVDQYDLPCDGTYRSIGGEFFRLEVDAGESANCVGGDFLWKQEPDGIRLATLHIRADTSAQDYWDIFRWMDRVWIKIG